MLCMIAPATARQAPTSRAQQRTRQADQVHDQLRAAWSPGAIDAADGLRRSRRARPIEIAQPKPTTTSASRDHRDAGFREVAAPGRALRAPGLVVP